MRHTAPSDDLISEIAWRYYVKGATQGEIATAKGLSRPTIISYLRMAKERGLVSIRLDPAFMRQNELAEAMRQRFGLNQVHVVDVGDLQGAQLTAAVAETGAHLLTDFVEKNDELGVSWGQTISMLAEAVPFVPVEGLVVRQLIGSMANPVLNTSESCTTEISRRLSSACVNMNAPAVCSAKATADALRREPIIAEQLTNLSRCNKAVFSLSPCTPDTHAVQFKVMTTEDIADYAARGAVCILAGRFLDAEGNVVTGELDDRLFAVQLEDLIKMDGMLVVAGQEKAHAARAALIGGYGTQAVLDIALAEQILALP